MRQDEYLLLDSSIRDWVVFPILIMLVLVGMGRYYIQSLIKSEPTIKSKQMEEMRIKQLLMRSSRLRTHGHYIKEDAFNRRKNHLSKKKSGTYSTALT